MTGYGIGRTPPTAVTTAATDVTQNAFRTLFAGVVLQALVVSVIAWTIGAALALAANFGVALLLYRWRDGDSNMRSVWICTRNDAIGNLAVLAAAAGVFGSGSGWPDYVVAAIMSGLALVGAFQVTRHAIAELRQSREAEPQAVGSL